jgi:hypothetical protein
MEGIPLARAHLESLATGDLFAIADKLGIDLPNNPGRNFPDRNLIIEELLDFSCREEGGSSGDNEPETTDLILAESAPLPKQYNITFIEVMIRDPLWAFVFWEIKASEKEQFEKDENFEGYYLKVSRLDENPSGSGNSGSFMVPVKPEDTAWYLSLSPAFEAAAFEADSSWAAQSRFKVEFCAGSGGVETAIAVSSPVRLPYLPELPSAGKHEASAAWGNELVRLSGYGDFHVLRKNERQIRVKKGEAENSNE